MSLSTQRAISLPSIPTYNFRLTSPSNLLTSIPPPTPSTPSIEVVNAQSHSLVLSPNTDPSLDIGDILANPEGEFRTVDYLYHPASSTPGRTILPTPGYKPSTFLVLIAERLNPTSKHFKLTGSLFAFVGTPEESRVEVNGNSCIEQEDTPLLGGTVVYRSRLFILPGSGKGIFDGATGEIRSTSYWTLPVKGYNRGPDWDDSNMRVRVGIWHLWLNKEAARGLQDSMFEQ